MKKQLQNAPHENFSQLNAEQAIELITQWIEERYPKLSPDTKSKIITQCLLEVRAEARHHFSLN